jgi:hypothetical protein
MDIKSKRINDMASNLIKKLFSKNLQEAKKFTFKISTAENYYRNANKNYKFVQQIPRKMQVRRSFRSPKAHDEILNERY